VVESDLTRSKNPLVLPASQHKGDTIPTSLPFLTLFLFPLCPLLLLLSSAYLLSLNAAEKVVCRFGLVLGKLVNTSERTRRPRKIQLWKS